MGKNRKTNTVRRVSRSNSAPSSTPSHIGSVLDRIFGTTFAVSGVLLFVVLFLYVWLSVDTMHQGMRRGDIMREQRSLEVEHQKLERELVRHKRRATLEAKARMQGFHRPQRDQMVRIAPTQVSVDEKQTETTDKIQ